jgi:hypothetical protein
MQGWSAIRFSLTRPEVESNDGRKLVRSIYFDDTTIAVRVVADIMAPRFHRIKPP